MPDSGGDFATRIDYVARHDATPFFPAEVGLAAVESDIPDLDLNKSLTYIARETELPLEMFFAPYSDPQGGESFISPNGVILSAEDARRFVDKATPEVIRELLPGIVDEYNEVAVVQSRRSKDRGSGKISTAGVAAILSSLYSGLAGQLDSIGFESLLGAALQVASRLKKPAQLEAFAQNLAIFRSQNAGHWTLWVSAAEAASANGVVYENVAQAMVESGLTGVDEEVLRAQMLRASMAEGGVRVATDPDGTRHLWAWDIVGSAWTEQPIQILDALGLDDDINGSLPTGWKDHTPNVETPEGGAYLEQFIDGATLQAAGFVAGGPTAFDVTRPEDFYRQTREIAGEIARRDRAWETSYLKVFLDSTLQGLNYGFQWAQGGATAAFTAASNIPFGIYAAIEEIAPGKGGGFERLGDYNQLMFGHASDILKGDATIGSTFAEEYNLHPMVGTLLVDLPSALVLDPLIMGFRGHRSLQAFHRFDEVVLGSRSFLGRQLMGLARQRGSSMWNVGEFLNRPPGAVLTDVIGKLPGGERAAGVLQRTGLSLDRRIGLPISGMYPTRGAQVRAFTEMQLRRPQSYLGNKTISEFLVDEALKGENLYDRANHYMRGYYHREAFHPDLTNNVEQVVRIMKETGEFSRVDMIDAAERVLLSGMGVKSMRIQELEALIYRPAIAGGSGAKMLRSGLRNRKELVEELVSQPIMQNTVGDARRASAADIILARQPNMRQLIPETVERITEYDLSYVRSLLDDVEHNIAGFRPIQLEFPRYSRARRMARAYRGSNFGASRAGRNIDALLFNRVPEAMVQFEEGRFVDNLARRLRRGRVYTPDEQAQILDRARLASSSINPSREREMVKILDEIARGTWDGLAREFNLAPESSELLFRTMMDDAEEINRKFSERAFGIKLSRDTAGEIVIEKNALTEAQLLNSYYVPDPLAMRRSIRDAVGVQERVSTLFRNLKVGISDLLPDELIGSTERQLVRTQLEDALSRANWQPTTIDWAAKVWDEIAINAVTNRPDLYPTIDDFFRGISVKFAESADSGALLKAIGLDEPFRTMDDLDAFLAARATDPGLIDPLSARRAQQFEEKLDFLRLSGRGTDLGDGVWRMDASEGRRIYLSTDESGRVVHVREVHGTDGFLPNGSVTAQTLGIAQQKGYGLKAILAHWRDEGVRTIEDVMRVIDPNTLSPGAIALNRKAARIVLGENGFRTLLKQESDQILGSFSPTDVGGIVSFFKDAKPSTLIHEAGHFIRNILPDDELKAVEAWLGTVDPQLRTYQFSDIRAGTNLARHRRAEELFADALEEYFRTDTVAPAVQSVFARLRDWLARVWRDIRTNPSQHNPELKSVFDEWLNPDRIGSAWAGGNPIVMTDAALQKAVNRTAHWLAHDVYLKLWKPAMVLRLGYIFRVPGMDEQIRFLTDLGIWSRLRSQAVIGKTLTRFAEHGVLPKGWVEEDYVINPLIPGEAAVPITRVIPGALPDEVYANSQAKLTELFPSFMDQVRSMEKGAVSSYHGEVTPAMREFPLAWDTAVNGHLSATSSGRRALQSVATDLSMDDTIADLVRWATDDPIGRRIYSRIGRAADEVEEWAEGLAQVAFRYTMGDPQIAMDALRRRASAAQLDEVIGRMTVKAQDAMAQRQGAARVLTQFEDANFEATANRLRAYIKAHGSATFDPVNGKFIEGKGYVVSMTDETAVKVSGAVLDDKKAFVETLKRYRDKVGSELSDYDESFFGAWVDDAGDLHLDPVEIHDNFEAAMGLGILRKQEAIFDLEKNREYTVFGKPTVHGQVVEHLAGENVSPMQVLINGASKAILQYPTNRLSRQPFFKAWYDRIMELQLELMNEAGYAPRTAMEAEATVGALQANARRFALDRVNRVMFNFRDQNRLSELGAFIAPFAQPWFEVFGVYGHLIRRNPALIGWARLSLKTAVDSGAIQKDPDTGEYIVPTSNFMGMAPLMAALSGWTGMGLSTPLASFNLFFNNALPIDTGGLAGVISLPIPSLSPPVTWVVQQFANEESSSMYTNWLFQYGRVGVDGFLPLPTWLQYAATSFGPEWLRSALGTNDAYKAYTDEFLRLDQYMGIAYDTTEEAVAAAERNAKTFFRYRAMIGFTFPGSVRVEFPMKHLEDKWRDYVTQYGADAKERFLEEHPDMWLITAAKTLWEKPDPNLPTEVWASMPSIPATREADAILQAPGFREFAEMYPAMAWALVIRSSGTGTIDYDPDVLMKQIAAADRKYKDPADFYESGESSAGWNAYWYLREWWEAKQEYLKLSVNVSEGNPEWEFAKGQYEVALNEIRKVYPSFSDEYGTASEELMDPRVMKYARAIAADKVFADLPIGGAVNDYLVLFDETRAEMRALGVPSIDSVSAVDAGISGRYETGVNDIIARVPEFERLYLAMFEGAALQRVKPEIENLVAALPEPEREQIFDWQRRWNDVKDQLDVAIDDTTRAPLYEQQAQLLLEAYEEHGVNPVQVWFQSQPFAERQEIIQRAQVKNPVYLSRFDRDLLKIETTPEAEAKWRLVANTRSEIFERDLTDPNFSVAAGFDALNAWIREQAAADPVFAQQVAIANTWGGVFFTNSEFVKADGPSGDAWRALQMTSAAYQAAVEQAGLHGTDADEERYTAVRRDFLSYIETLKQWDATFSEQWDTLEAASNSDLAETFFPTTWFRLGSE